MSDFLRNWITDITVIIIFIMFMDTIMPNNSMKRYINVIIGLLIIVVIIKPFVLVNEFSESFNGEYIETASFLEMDRSEVKSTEITKYQQQKAIEIFEDNLKKKLTTLIESNVEDEYRGVEVSLELDRDIESKSFGSVKAVKVRLGAAGKDVIEVDRIKIEVNQGTTENKNVINEDKGEYNLNDSKISSEIKDIVSKALGISESVVSVSVQH